MTDDGKGDGDRRGYWCPTCGVDTADGEDCDGCTAFWEEASRDETIAKKGDA